MRQITFTVPKTNIDNFLGRVRDSLLLLGRHRHPEKEVALLVLALTWLIILEDETSSSEWLHYWLQDR